MTTLKAGTRGSQLAWTQAGQALERIEERVHGGASFERVRIETRGDKDQHTPLSVLPGTGLFVKELEVALVYPEDADDRAGKLSVCSGIGTAILGYREGDAFDWRIPNRTCHIRIEKVLYQPEAAGDFHL